MVAGWKYGSCCCCQKMVILEGNERNDYKISIWVHLVGAVIQRPSLDRVVSLCVVGQSKILLLLSAGQGVLFQWG
jgi:hypothetical protein